MPTYREQTAATEPPPAPSIPADPSGATVGPDTLSRQRVIPLRHPGRWIAALVVTVFVAQVIESVATNRFFQWDRFGYWFLRPVVVDGLLVTLEVTAWTAVLGLLGGIVLALGRLSRNPILSTLSWAYVWLFRSIPLIVVLLFLYNFSAIYPQISIGVPFGPVLFSVEEARLAPAFVLAVIGLTLNESAYAAEVVRGGILSVDRGQHEAAASLGMPKLYQFRRIVLPQALRSIIPNYVNQLIGLIKGTSLVFYVSLLDLFGTVQSMGATYSGDIVPLLMVATVWYVILTSIVSVVQFYVERYYARGAVAVMPPTPLQRVVGQVREGWSLLTARGRT
ncbi:amino acid ABC transporter permease [Phytohabitans suffuscus]|uniref:Amino acid ABC transporter permease n=1 Tax=Phytohabitans suffuscus TaxID=624315 RepID=A0A6F8YAU6_9ACTN|nr:amino acid ABC transporter permease [Phytohabitans suffuscus]BCB83225.1 amino acid ABC transporter permease [Phytohabitans suffuscus]